MSVFSAQPVCFVEIYPYEGGAYDLVGHGSHLLSAHVSKSNDGSPGGFTLQLAPNGLGTSNNPDVPDWTEVITPMSLVLIGMQRWQYSQTVLIGVVTSVSTSQNWVNNGQVVRTITVVGRDFSQFFGSFNWSVLSFQAVFGGSALGEGLLGNANAGTPASISQGLLGGTSSAESNPAVIGQNWYSNIMAGTKGILAKTQMPYQQSFVTFNDAMSTVFEIYPDVFIPFYDNFLSAQGSWTQKFRAIFPAPWYEFFVITAPLGHYGLASHVGYPFKMTSLPAAQPTGPVLVARVSPFPRLIGKSAGAGVPFTLTGIDSSLWTALQLYTLDHHGFLVSTLVFSAESVRNAYTLNPTTIRALFGDSNTSTNVFFYSFCGAIDVASIHRYGFRPEITATEWMGDPTGAAGAQSLDVSQTVVTLLCQAISFYQPTPLMASGTVVIPLRPDILPGGKFEYSPFRGENSWTFYVENVEHDFQYGGNSVTTLSLSRGLPTKIYQDFSTDGIYYALLTGTAERANGSYSIREATKNDVGLTIYGSQPEQLAALAASIAQAYASPQTS